MGTYRKISVIFLFNCLMISQSVFSSDIGCSALQEKYQLKGIIIPLNKIEKKLLLQQVTEVLSIAESRATFNFIDFKKLKEEILTVNLCVNLSPESLVGSGARKGSVYFNREKSIVFNSRKLFSSIPLGRSLVMVHEFLGALGYPDQNYQIITALYSLIQKNYFGYGSVSTVEKSLETYLKNARHLDKNISYSSNGGVTGVGGGGDTEVVIIKAFTLNIALINIKELEKIMGISLSREELSLYILNYNLETSDVLNSSENINFGSSFLAYKIFSNNEIGIIIKEKRWESLERLGSSSYDEKNKFITNLILKIIASYKWKKDENK